MLIQEEKLTYEDTLLLKEEIKSKVNIRDAMLQHGVGLLDHNSGYKGIALCPFHNEHTPSFSVDYEKGVYHCFGCKSSGDVISFIKDKLNLASFYDAISYLCKTYDIDIVWTEKTRDKQLREKAFSTVNKSSLIKDISSHRELFDRNLFELNDKINLLLSIKEVESSDLPKFFPFFREIDDIVESEEYDVYKIQNLIKIIDKKISIVRSNRVKEKEC